MQHSKEGIIAKIEYREFKGSPIALLLFHNDLTIVLEARSIACYKDAECIGDPLGNGLVDLAEVPKEHSIKFEHGVCVTLYKSGYVQLIDNKALLITPHSVRLFANNQDALRGINCLTEVRLPEIDLL